MGYSFMLKVIVEHSLSIRECTHHSHDIVKTFIDSAFRSQVLCLIQTFSYNSLAHDKVLL